MPQQAVRTNTLWYQFCVDDGQHRKYKLRYIHVLAELYIKQLQFLITTIHIFLEITLIQFPFSPLIMKLGKAISLLIQTQCHPAPQTSYIGFSLAFWILAMTTVFQPDRHVIYSILSHLTLWKICWRALFFLLSSWFCISLLGLPLSWIRISQFYRGTLQLCPWNQQGACSLYFFFSIAASCSHKPSQLGERISSGTIFLV